MRVIAYYTAAVLTALILLIASLIPLVWYGVLLIPALIIIAIGTVLVTAFLIDYVKYAEKTWADFPATLSGLALPLFYFLIYAALLAGSGLQIAIAASAAIALAIAALRGNLYLTSGDIIGDIKGGTKTLPLAIVLTIPLGLFAVAGYEAYRMWKEGARAAASAVFISLLFAWAPIMYALPASAMASDMADVYPANPLAAWILDILLWPGIIGWEEMISRMLLPAAGWAANYLFVAFHTPKFIIYSLHYNTLILMLTPAFLAVLSFGTRWLTDVYRRHGVVGSLTAHAVYNGSLGFINYILFIPYFIVSALVLIYAYITRPKE